MLFSRTLVYRISVAAAAGGILACVAAPVALAHDVVLGGNPADGEVLDTFPRSIDLEFSGLPQGSFTTMALSNQDSSEILFSGEPVIDGKVVSLDLPAEVTGGPGSYTVGFQITSSDGHATRDSTTFTVAGATAPPSEAPSAEPVEETAAAQKGTAEVKTGSTAGQMALLAVAGLGIFAVLAGVIMAVAKSREPSLE